MLMQRDRIVRARAGIGPLMQSAIALMLILGILLRLVGLGHQNYWYDEAFTSLRTSGYTEAEVVQQLNTATVVTAADLQRYQHPHPQRGLPETLHSLALEDPQHPPLYYTLATFWSRWVGSSVAAMRLLPALISLLALPSVYWLCRELFAHTGKLSLPGVGWLAAALLAVSPLQWLYAQEARQYSLWSVTSLLTTAALLRALRLRTGRSWVLYGLTMALNLYTFLLAILLVLAHGLYVLAHCKFRPQPRLGAYLAATVVALGLFLPWIWVVASNFAQADAVTSWTKDRLPLLSLVKSWVSVTGRTFFSSGTWLDTPAFALVGLLVAYSFYRLLRHTPSRVGLLVSLSVGLPFLVLIAADLLRGGLRSTYPRYLIQVLVGVAVVVAYLLAERLNQTTAQTKAGLFWRGLTLTLLLGGLISCGIMAQSTGGWHRDRSLENHQIAQIVNRARSPLLVSDAEVAALLALSHRLEPTVALLVRPSCYTCAASLTPPAAPPAIPEGYRSIFLYDPQPQRQWPQLLAAQPQYTLVPLVTEDDAVVLWRLEPQTIDQTSAAS